MKDFMEGSYCIIKLEYVESSDTQLDREYFELPRRKDQLPSRKSGEILEIKKQPKMYNDTQRFINNCETCLNKKYEKNPSQVNNNLTETPSKSFEKVNIDTLTLERRKYLTSMGQFNKHAQVYYLKNLNANSIVNALIKYFSNYKVPEEVMFDASTDFNNNLVTELLKMYKI